MTISDEEVAKLKQEINDLKFELEKEKINNLKGYKYERCRADKLQSVATKLFSHCYFDELPRELIREYRAVTADTRRDSTDK
jgi:hypothetical protein